MRQVPAQPAKTAPKSRKSLHKFILFAGNPLYLNNLQISAAGARLTAVSIYGNQTLPPVF
jgi:hypothetical protein